MDPRIKRRLVAVQHLVGHTPLLRIDLTFRGEPRRVFAKAENLNMTGSVKDRMALHILRRGYDRGTLAPGARVIEATSGNTGISFAALGRALGHPVTICMPDWMSRERIELIRSLGAEMRLVAREEGGFVGAIALARRLAEECEDCFLPEQFENDDNVEAHYATTGPEIFWQLRSVGLVPDAFVAGVGTGGTVMGVGGFLRERHRDVRIHPLEPVSSPTLSMGRQVGEHRIQGISDEFVPAIVDLSELDDIVSVDDGDAIIMAQRLAAELGLGVGISSGANLLGAIIAQDALGPDAVVVTIFADDNKKYLSTDLLREEPVKADFLSRDIELREVGVIKRACVTCCDPDTCERDVDMLASEGAPVRPDCPRRS